MEEGKSFKDGVERVLGGVVRVSVWTKIVQFVVVLCFLVVFAPYAYMGGMYFGTLVVSGLGIFGTYWALDHEEGLLSGAWRGVVCRLLYLEHAILFVLALVGLFSPLEGGWKRVKASDDWSGEIKPFEGRPGEILAWTGRGKLYVKRGGGRWAVFSESAPSFTGWAVSYDIYRNWLWFGLHRGDRLNFYDFRLGRWKGLPCPRGQVRQIANWRDRIFIVVGGRAYMTGDGGDDWREVDCGGGCRGVGSLNSREAQMVLIAGRKWMQSEDGGSSWRDVRPKGAKLVGGGRVALGKGGWRYLYAGGMFEGYLYVGGPGRGFVRKSLPVGDIRILRVHPEKPEHIWMGTWGRGVYHSKDAGTHWEYWGLQGIEIRTMALDIPGQKIYAGVANMVFRRGLYVRSLQLPPVRR